LTTPTLYKYDVGDDIMDTVNDLIDYYQGPNGELPSFYTVGLSMGAAVVTY